MIRDDVPLYVEEIKRQLWSGQASLLVGSGFSKNAELCSSDTPIPPTWDELKKTMADRLYPERDKKTREAICNSKEVTQMAFEYEKRFERKGLEGFLEEQIQDQNLQPGELHRILLELPWKDVFTTNYDTLLERAAKELISRKYNLISRCQDLAHVNSPRLIKLHGTLHSQAMPLIITEEDYRRYQNDQALFVNTVQQAIVTTNLCLIGFSGTDPNFKQWTGWVRDILKDDCPQIYLINKWDEEPSISEQDRYEDFHIKMLDLAYWGKDKDHKDLLDIFLCNLFDDQKYNNFPEVDLKHMSPSLEAIKNKEKRHLEFSELLDEWKTQREKNANRLFVPPKERKIIALHTERWSMISQFCAELPAGEDIRGLFEYNWRLEQCLMPILYEDIQYYESIVKRHNPFRIKDDLFFSNNAFVVEEDDSEKDFMQRIWIELMFAVLRWKRENLFAEDFVQYKAILEKVLPPFSGYGKRLMYERALFAMASPDFEELTYVMTQWGKDLSSPEWNIKYASIIAELGDFNETWRILNQSWQEIRKHTIGEDCGDLFLCGLEGIALTGVHQCLRGKALNKAFEIADREETRVLAGNTSVLQNDQINETIIRQRLKALYPLGCDPFYDLERFQLSLSNLPKERYIFGKETRVFDHTIVTFSTGYGWDSDAVVGFQYIRFLEETGLLQHLGFIGFVDKQLINAIKRIARYSYSLAFAAFNRIGTKEKADYEIFLSQSIINDLTNAQADGTICHYIKEVKWLIDNAKDKLSESFNNFYKKTFITLLESISRLLVKTTPEVQQSVLDLLFDLYSRPIGRFGVETQLRNSVKRLFESMSADLICKNLVKFLHLELPQESHVSFWCNPFDHIKLHKPDLAKIKNRDAISSSLDAWFVYLDSGTDWQRRNALNVLIVFYDLEIMNKNQIQHFAKGLFSRLDDHGLPVSTDLCFWVFVKLAQHLDQPQTIADDLLRLYTDYSFSVHDSTFQNICYSILPNLSVTRGNPKARLNTSDQNIQEIFNHVRSSVFLFLDQDSTGKNGPYNPFIENKIPFNFVQLDRIVAEIIIPRMKDETKRSQITEFLQRSEMFRPFPSSRCALLQREDVFPEKMTLDFIVAFSSSDRDIFYLYFCAILNAYIRAKNKTGPSVPTKIFYCLLNALAMKTDETFKMTCGTLTAILDYYDMDRQEKDLMLRHLEQLETETRFSQDKSRFPYESRYDYRIAAGGLAARVYKTFVDRDETELPEPLQRWKSICNSPDEFPGLRNKWDEVVNNDK